MLQKSPLGIQKKPWFTLVRPQYDLNFRLNLVVEFNLLCSTVPGYQAPPEELDSAREVGTF